MRPDPWAVTVAFDLWPVVGKSGWHWKPALYRSSAVSYHQFKWLCFRVDVFR